MPTLVDSQGFVVHPTAVKASRGRNDAWRQLVGCGASWEQQPLPRMAACSPSA